jgi:ABC-2 type transport system permease protein
VKQFLDALWVEGLKARRSRVPPLTAGAISLGPLVGGLFMVILKDPDRARSMGLLSTKAQLVGVADWPTYLDLIAQIAAVGGLLVFAFAIAWLFGRELADRTAKEWLAVPTSRSTDVVVAAKFGVAALWVAGLTGLLLVLGFVVGSVVGIPGWSPALGWRGAGDIVIAGGLTLLVSTPVAFFASFGRGYLAGLAWAMLTLVLAEVAGALGWGGWFPWSVPGLFAQIAGERAAHVGPHSYIVVVLACAAGVAATVWWWRYADHTR